ncbi:Cellulose synthase operon protein C precursor [compost metagenome]
MTRWGLLLSAVCGAALGQPLNQADQQQWLLEQMRIGEALYREELVRDSLARLELIAPGHPEVLLAEYRHALQVNDQAQAERRLAQLRTQAYGSQAQRQAEALLKMQKPEGQKLLQEARLRAAAGRFDESIALYEQLFGNTPPDFASAFEYWGVRSRITEQRPQVIEQLRALDQRYPGNPELRQMLARLLFAQQRDGEALAVLHQLANDPQASNAAAEREFNYLASRPVSADTARAWQVFLDHYPNSPLQGEAGKRLQGQQQLLGDPAWQAGIKGQQLLEQGNNAAAEAKLRQALRRYPDEAGFYGALGTALMRQSKYEAAYAAFSTAVAKEQDTDFISKWQDLKAANGQWMLLQKGDQALQRNDLAAAKNAYRQASKAQPDDADALIGLANVALAEGDQSEAQALLLKVRKIEPDNGSAVRALVRLYKAQSPDKAEAFLETLPPAQQREFVALRRSIELDRLNAQADAAMLRGDWAQAAALLGKARALSPDEPWLTYRLANSLYASNQPQAADDSFTPLLQRQGLNPEARYAHALYLASHARDNEALASMQHIATTAWNQNMHDLATRLQRRQMLAQATALRDSGQEAQAVALLLRDPNADDWVTVADWALLRGDTGQAKSYYRKALAQAPQNSEAQLGLIEALIAGGETEAARRQLSALTPIPQANYQRRVANAWAGVGETGKASELFAQLLETPQSDPLVYRDAARLMARQQPQQALDNHARAMAAAGLLTPAQAEPRDNRALTLASREKDSDDWMLRSLRSDVDELYQQQTPTVNLYHDFAWRTDNSSAGVSDLATHTTILRVDLPIAQGQGFVQAENIDLDVKAFDSDDQFGTCAVVIDGCRPDAQSVRGTMLGIGWSDARWAIDLGHTPQEFTVSNWVGGVTFSSDWRDIGYRLTASRRPLTNSLVSYAGAVDPVTGIEWGGVTANGFTLGLSHDEGEADGLWASLGLHWLKGEHVADNQKRTAMGGYYYRLIERADERLRTGLTLMYMGYDKDLSEYTLGQGGYYSPQHYYSVSVPLNYAWRNADWSVALESSLGWSFSKSSASDLYPLDDSPAKVDSLLEQFSRELVDDPSLRSNSSSSSDIGIRLQGLVERRLSDNLVLGGGIVWQHSEDYAPSRGLIYLRYTFDPWQGNLPLPVQPISPYAEMR